MFIWCFSFVLSFNPPVKVEVLSIFKPKRVIVSVGENYELLSAETLKKIKKFKGNPYVVVIIPKKIKRAYKGQITVEPTGMGFLRIINTVPLNDYLSSVVGAEMPESSEKTLEALKSQAVLSRTLIVKSNFYAFSDLTSFQVYKGMDSVNRWSIKAVKDTDGKVLVSPDGNFAEPFFFSTCGGHTESPESVWGKRIPYLRGVSDVINGKVLCRKSPHFGWKWAVSSEKLAEVFGEKSVESVKVVKRSGGGGVKTVEVVFGSGNRTVMSGYAFRMKICRAFGWNSLKSSAFSVMKLGEKFVFTGRGLGHRVGLCQYGAVEMAKMGYTFAQILKHYFPLCRVSTVGEVSVRKVWTVKSLRKFKRQIAEILPAGKRTGIVVLEVDSARPLIVVDRDMVFKERHPFGSLVKPFTVIAWWKTGKFNPDTVYKCLPSSPSANPLGSCWYHPGHGRLNLVKAIANSCNYYFYRIALEVPFDVELSVLRQFGLGRFLIRSSLDKEDELMIEVGLGAKLKDRMIDVLSAYLSLFNGGKLPIFDRKGVLVRFRITPLPPRKVLDVIVRGMKGSVVFGTSKKAFKILRTGAVLGKTGTALGFKNGRVDWTETDGFWIGFAPSYSPKVAVMVRVENGIGSDDAVPVGAKLLQIIRSVWQ